MAPPATLQLIGRVGPAQTPLYYSAPARIATISTDAEFAALKQELDRVRAGGPWLWVVNCAGMRLEHVLNARYVQRLADLLRTEHTGLLLGTWMLQINTWVRGILAGFGAEATVLSDDRLELFLQLQRAGCSHATVDFLLAVVAT
ncbi:hypothetical protein EBZ80_13575 [bacterium]|nr:hypothetical protein [bacterium]